jgi:hypothetical protein
MNPPVKKGERLVVYGRPEQAIVADCIYAPVEARWVIVLDWGQYGVSRVYDHDEGKVWFRYSQVS